ncbi:hypothetical protein [Aeromonas sobria]|uniref:hypothetical protein n=1 Tax=Aeromonas sobria TaxID=646 RepID=UPI0013968592|nr:hypothetical protein [Aeromonas sobria]
MLIIIFDYQGYLRVALSFSEVTGHLRLDVADLLKYFLFLTIHGMNTASVMV